MSDRDNARESWGSRFKVGVCGTVIVMGLTLALDAYFEWNVRAGFIQFLTAVTFLSFLILGREWRMIFSLQEWLNRPGLNRWR